ERKMAVPAGMTPPERSRSRGRMRALRVLACLCLLLLLAGVYRWYSGSVPKPPEVDTSGREPEIVAAIEAARAEAIEQPRSGKAWGRLGMVLLAHDYEAEAQVCLARAEELDPDEPRWAYLNGWIIEGRDPEAALPLLRRAAALAGHKPEPHLHLAETLLGLGRIDEAQAEFRHVLNDDPTHPHPRARLGLARIASQQGRLDEALDQAREAALLVPKLRSAQALLAEIHHRRGDAAAEEKVLALLPTCQDLNWPDPYLEEIEERQVGSPARLARANRLWQEGRLNEALVLLQKAAAAPEPSQARF